MEFWQKSLADAEEICRGIFNHALASRALLQGGGDSARYAPYRPFDVKPLQDALAHAADGGTQYLILGRLRPNDAFDPSGLSMMFGLGGDFSTLNDFVATQAKGASTEPPALAIMLPAIRTLDRILFESRMLVDMFHHAGAIAASPGLSICALVLAGVEPRSNFTAEQLMLFAMRFSDLVEKYHAAHALADRELREAALDPAAMAERLGQFPGADRLMWIIQPEHPGAKMVNGVWIPDVYVDLLLKPPKPAAPKPDKQSEYRPAAYDRSYAAGGWFRRGRINRKTYWVFLIVSLIVVTALRRLGPAGSSSGAVLLLLCVPRLHDIGLSGWIAGAGLFLQLFFGIVIGVAHLAPQQTTTDLALIGLLTLALMALLGCVPGDRGPNRWGDPPGRGLSFSKPT